MRQLVCVCVFVCSFWHGTYTKCCVFVYYLPESIYSVVTQHSADGRFPLHLRQIESLAARTGGSSQTPSQAFLMRLHWAIWRSALFPRCSGKQRFIITHDLLSLASSISYRHCIWKISVHALVSILVLVPELIMGNEHVLPTSSYKAFLPYACIHY